MYDHIAKKYIMVQKCSEENEIHVPIIKHPKIVKFSTPFIGKRNCCFGLAATNYWISDRCKYLFNQNNFFEHN